MSWFIRILAALLAGAALSAQAPPDCDGRAIRASMRQGEASASERYEKLKPDIAAAKWSAVGEALVSEFKASPILKGERRAALLASLEAMAGDLAKADGEASREAIKALLDPGRPGFVDLNRFKPYLDNTAGTVNYFDTTSPPRTLLVDCTLSEAERVQVFHWTTLGARVLSAFGEKDRARTLKAIDNICGRWDNFIQYSYAQYPWELIVNGLDRRDRSALNPPRHQLILLHPSAGIEIIGGPTAAKRRADVAMVEPIGYLWYRKDYAFYLGASLVLTQPSDRPPGVGAMIHLGRYGKAGYVWRRKDGAGHSQNGVLFSLDLYGWLGDHAGALKEFKGGVAALGR